VVNTLSLPDVEVYTETFLSQFSTTPFLKLAVILLKAEKDKTGLPIGKRANLFITNLIKGTKQLFSIQKGKGSLNRFIYQYKSHLPYILTVYTVLTGENTEKVYRKIAKHYTENYRGKVVEEPLLTGKDIIQILGIPPSKQVGILKEKLLNEQIEGRIKTKTEAENFIKAVYKGDKDVYNI